MHQRPVKKLILQFPLSDFASFHIFPLLVPELKDVKDSLSVNQWVNKATQMFRSKPQYLDNYWSAIESGTNYIHSPQKRILNNFGGTRNIIVRRHSQCNIST